MSNNEVYEYIKLLYSTMNFDCGIHFSEPCTKCPCYSTDEKHHCLYLYICFQFNIMKTNTIGCVNYSPEEFVEAVKEITKQVNQYDYNGIILKKVVDTLKNYPM